MWNKFMFLPNEKMGKCYHKAGFTFVEVMIGLLIFSFIGTSFILVIRGMKKEIQFGGDHFTALLLSQKVMEDLAQEVIINPYGLETLGIDGKTGVPVKIVDGNSPFFTSLFDIKSPWFSIDPQTDGKIDSSISPLYSQTRDFQVAVSSARGAPLTDPSEKKNLEIGTVEFSWKPSAGHGKYDLSCYFPSVLTEKKVDFNISISDADLEKEICKTFFVDPNSNLATIISTKGGDAQTLKELGKISFVCSQFFKSEFFKNTLTKIQGLETKRKKFSPALGKDYAKTCTELAQNFYELAKSSYQMMAFLEPCFEKVSVNFDQQHLGNDLWLNKDRLKPAMVQFKKVCDNFNSSLFWARVNYENLLDKQVSISEGYRRQFLTTMRLLDLYRVFAVNPGWSSGKADLLKFIERIQKISQGRNPFLHRFCLQESDWSRNIDGLATKYPNLKKIQEVLDQISKILPFVQANS